jgi:uncharacterized membrane protein YgaE (UPF0421/DUF939 family)
MEKYKEFIPGRRIMKTAIAVFISVQLFNFFGHYNPVHAALACILTMRTTSDETKSRGKNRLIGTLVGGVSSYLCLVFFQYFPIVTSESVFAPAVVALFVLLSLLVSKALQLAPYAIAIAAVVTTVTLLSHNTHHLDALSYVSLRMFETLVGFIIAYLVNKYLLPRRKKKKT